MGEGASAGGRKTGPSCWVATTPERAAFAPLAGAAADADVAVVGGGIVGITTALLVARAGRSVVLLEAGRLGRQVTGGSTAKVTTQHGLIYDHLSEHVGSDAADAYARSNEAGFEWIARQVHDRGIDCDFERCAAYAYATSAEQAAAVEREAEAAVRIGLPASLERTSELPFPIVAAVRFDNQARFHPTRYLLALAAELAALGARIHEGTRVVDVDNGKPCTVVTAHGRVRAKDVVVATNIPILDRGGFFGRAFPYRHMCLAAPVPKERAPEGMHIGVDSPTRSLRSAPWSDTERLLVLIGEAFPTGHGSAAERLAALEAFAREHFGVEEPLYRWGNQDYYSIDRVPFVGPILPGLSHIRVATGFNAWGITTGTAAALILADDVLGRRSEFASLYDSRRLGLRAGGRKLIEKNLGVAKSWIAEHLTPAPERAPAEIRVGDAAIVRLEGKAAAAYRDEEGVLHAVDARCTHMGCQVEWNDAERSWDCHCHGSRFDPDGNVLNGPATHPLSSLTGSG